MSLPDPTMSCQACGADSASPKLKQYTQRVLLVTESLADEAAIGCSKGPQPEAGTGPVGHLQQRPATIRLTLNPRDDGTRGKHLVPS